MASLNIDRTIAKVKVNRRYTIYFSDAIHIKESSADWFKMIHNAFRLGYAQGQKAERAAARRKEREQ